MSKKDRVTLRDRLAVASSSLTAVGSPLEVVIITPLLTLWLIKLKQPACCEPRSLIQSFVLLCLAIMSNLVGLTFAYKQTNLD